MERRCQRIAESGRNDYQELKNDYQELKSDVYAEGVKFQSSEETRKLTPQVSYNELNLTEVVF